MEETTDPIAIERERVAGLVESAMRSLARAIREGDPAPPRRTRTRTAKPQTAQPASAPTPSPSITPESAACMDTLWEIYPPRPEPYPYVAVRAAVNTLLREGVPPRTLVDAVVMYRQDVERRQVEPQYIAGMLRFFRDGLWKAFATKGPLVFGRSREEWKRSGQDVLEFDRLAQQQHQQQEERSA